MESLLLFFSPQQHNQASSYFLPPLNLLSYLLPFPLFVLFDSNPNPQIRIRFKPRNVENGGESSEEWLGGEEEEYGDRKRTISERGEVLVVLEGRVWCGGCIDRVQSIFWVRILVGFAEIGRFFCCCVVVILLLMICYCCVG